MIRARWTPSSQSYDSLRTEEVKGTTDVQQLNNEIDQAVSDRSTTPHHTVHPRAEPSPDPPPPHPPPPPHSPPLPPSLCRAQIAEAGHSESVIAEWLTTYKAELTVRRRRRSEDIHSWHFHDYLRTATRAWRSRCARSIWRATSCRPSRWSA